jgi:hypothetical protein
VREHPGEWLGHADTSDAIAPGQRLRGKARSTNSFGMMLVYPTVSSTRAGGAGGVDLRQPATSR